MPAWLFCSRLATSGVEGSHRVKVVGGDATDGQNRNLDLVDDGLELGQAAWRHAWMGSGRKDVAEREVLRALLGCLGCLV